MAGIFGAPSIIKIASINAANTPFRLSKIPDPLGKIP